MLDLFLNPRLHCYIVGRVGCSILHFCGGDIIPVTSSRVDPARHSPVPGTSLAGIVRCTLVYLLNSMS